MIYRRNLESYIRQTLNRVPAVGLIGTRQVGKTTLALEIAKSIEKPTQYIDLELDSDLAKLNDAEAFIDGCRNKLLIIDEVQRKPDLFPTLRSFIDSRIRDGEHTAQFLILGSASPALLKQSSESLAGRIQYLELNPFSVSELANLKDEFQDLKKLWLNGGYPKSALTIDDEASFAWRGAYISTFVERDVQLTNSRIPPDTLRTLWSLLAWQNAQQTNFSRIAANLGISYKTVQRYVGALESAFILRRLRPWSTNPGKRLVKAPKIYLRDSGLTHRMLRISGYDDLVWAPGDRLKLGGVCGRKHSAQFV